MKRWHMTEQLAQTVLSRIDAIESEESYMKELLAGLSPRSSASAVDGMVGTMVPKLFANTDTFITNPQGVGIGILSRMVETDPTVLSSLMLKSQMMLSKIGEYQHPDKEIEGFVRDFLHRMEGPTWPEALEAMSSFVPYGFSVSEIGWGLDKKLKKVPTRVKTYHPSTICFEVDGAGNVTEDGIVQFTIQNAQFQNPNFYRRHFFEGFERNPFETPEDQMVPYRVPFVSSYGLVRIPKSKCIHHVNNSMTSFGSPYGKAYVRVAHLAWQLKVFFMKQMGVAGKRNAQPFIHGTAPMNNNKVQYRDPNTGALKMGTPIEVLTAILAERSEDDSVVTGPENIGYSINAVLNQADLNQYLAVLGWLDTQIFRGFMLPSLIMTEGNAGSRSLGDKHFQIVDRIAETEAEKFNSTIIRQLIRPAIEDNFGEQEEYGHFAQRPQSIDERERLANLYSTLASAQFMNAHNPKDGDYVRSSLHLPDQDDSFYENPMPNFTPANQGGGKVTPDAPSGDEAGEGGEVP